MSLVGLYSGPLDDKGKDSPGLGFPVHEWGVDIKTPTSFMA